MVTSVVNNPPAPVCLCAATVLAKMRDALDLSRGLLLRCYTHFDTRHCIHLLYPPCANAAWAKMGDALPDKQDALNATNSTELKKSFSDGTSPQGAGASA